MQAGIVVTKVLTSLKYSACILSVSHSDAKVCIAGTERVIRSEQGLFLENGVSYLHIFPKQYAGHSAFKWFGLRADGHWIGYLTASQLSHLWPILELLGIRISFIHFHHLLGTGPKTATEIIENLTSPARFFIHDYYSVCTQFNLMFDDKTYCDGPPLGSVTCGDCKHGFARANHFEQFNSLLSSRCDEFIAPSAISAREWSKSYPHLRDKLQIVSHLREVSRAPILRNNDVTSPIRIAYVGYEAKTKGIDTWKRFIERVRDPAFECYHLGQASYYSSQVEYVSVLNADNPHAMADALHEHEIDVAFLWSIWPETYSFTALESLYAGSFIVTNTDSGNVAKLVLETGNGIVFERESDCFEFLEDATRVRELLRKHRSSNMRIIYEMNPELVETSLTRIAERGMPVTIENGKIYQMFADNSKLCRNFSRATEFSNHIEKLESDYADLAQYVKQVESEVLRYRKLRSSLPYRTLKRCKQIFLGFIAMFTTVIFPKPKKQKT